MSQKKYHYGIRKNIPMPKKKNESRENYFFVVLLYEFEVTLSGQDAFMDQQKRLLRYALAI